MKRTFSNPQQNTEKSFSKQTNLNHSNSHDSNDLLNFIAAQKLFNTMQGSNSNNFFRHKERQCIIKFNLKYLANDFNAHSMNESNKNDQINLLYQMLRNSSNRNQAPTHNQYSSSNSNNNNVSQCVNSCCNQNSEMNRNLRNITIKSDPDCGGFFNQSNTNNSYLNNSGFNFMGNNIPCKKNKTANTYSTLERRSTSISSKNGANSQNAPNYQFFSNLNNQEYLHMNNKELQNTNSMNYLNSKSMVKPHNNLNNNNFSNSNPHLNSLSFLSSNLHSEDVKINNKINNPFDITFDENKPCNDEFLNIFSPTSDIRHFLKTEKEKEEEILHNFDLSDYFKADGY